MRVEKEKLKVIIFCLDGTAIKGFLHLNQGERLQDLLNNTARQYVPVTVVELFAVNAASYATSEANLLGKKDLILLNKESMKWIEESD